MSTTQVTSMMRDRLGMVDVRSRVEGREALREMVSLGQIKESALSIPVAPERMMRKSIKNLTVQELINMGIVNVVKEARK